MACGIKWLERAKKASLRLLGAISGSLFSQQYSPLAFASWGLLLSLQPAFYPTEAEIHGATPSQYGFVFGCSSLAAFLFGPIFGTYGERIGPKLLFNLGGLTQGLVGIAFGSLDYIENTAGNNAALYCKSHNVGVRVA